MKQNSLLDEKLNEMIQLYDMGYSMVLLYDERGNILQWNLPAEQSLNKDGHLHQMNMTELIPNIFFLYGSQVYVSPENININVKALLHPRCGACIPAELKINYREVKEVTIGICVVHDLSERMEYNIEKNEIMNHMTKAVQKRTEYLAQITHDLKTPVNGIYGLAEALELHTVNEEERECLKLMKACCKHMKGMIDQVLEHEELVHGGCVLQEEYVDLYRVIENTVSIHRMMAEKEGLQLYVNVSDHIPRIIYTDRKKIVEIMNNLLTNAIKFTQIGFISINVMLAHMENSILTILFMVQDTGCGIKPERQKEIFEPFHHEDSHRNQHYGGTGLGLTIVKSLVEVFKGSMKVESIPGAGSKFYFTIKTKLENDPAQKGIDHVPAGDDMEELAQRMEETLLLEVEKKHFHKIMKAKTFGTKENRMEIVHNIQNIYQEVELEQWELVEHNLMRLKLLIPESQSEIREQLLRAELSARRKDSKKTRIYVSMLEKRIKAA